jgi:imidazolonepropionase-like amidohydrolase
VVYARRTLEAGFTTVRDLGGEPTAVKALRDAIDQGWIPGPKIYAATASLASTGGHADPTNGLRAELTGDPGAAVGIVNGVEDARKAVRQRYKEGADLIKITATGGVLSLAKSGLNAQLTEEEIRAIVETARDYGFHVAAHAHGLEGIKRAVRAGVASIEHGTYMDAEAFALLKQHGTYFVPTISAGRFVAEKAAVPGYFPEIVRPKAAAIGPLIQDTFAKAYRAGVKIAFGTDCGVSPHGSNAKELEYMVEAGMPALEALRAATTTTAELLGIAADVGTLATGKRADVIAVAGNPLDDVKLLQDVRFVMKGGVVVKAPGAHGADAPATAAGWR